VNEKEHFDFLRHLLEKVREEAENASSRCSPKKHTAAITASSSDP